jgi:hypothetical protein
MKKIFTLLLLVLSVNAFSQSTTVVISQVYGGGGGASGTYKYDYVELHNVSNSIQDISGMSIAYGSATGQFGSSSSNYYTFPASTTIAAGKYLLIQTGSMGSGGVDLPVTPDLTTSSISASGSSGKIALVTSGFTINTCGATASPCPLPNSNIIDLVAYGAANNAEGGVSVNNGSALTSIQGSVRKNLGCKDSDHNNNDFDVVTDPVPRNSASGEVDCTTLPLSLSSFKVELNNGKANLQWTSQNEVNVNGFSIEKSLNGVKFSEIGFVQANNRSSNSYSTIDENVKPGTNYYRLKMTDLDGSFRYSNIVLVSEKAIMYLDVYPNPAANILTVRHDKSLQKANIVIVTMDGRQVASLPVQLGATQSSISLENLVKGNYMVIYTNNGARSVVKFSKQ